MPADKMVHQQPDPPVDFDSLRALIKAKHTSFPKRLSQVARYLIDNPDETALGSVGSIAEAAQVTPSTVMRFAQLLGYDGFTALQEIFRRNIRAKLSLNDDATGWKSPERSSPSHPLSQTINACCNALSGLTNMVTTIEIDGAVEILSRARCVFIQGSRSTFPMTVALQQALTRKGIRCTLSMDLTGGDDVLALATNDDAVIFISRSADAERVFHALPLAAKGVPIIAIVDSSLSPYTDVASISFKLGRPDDTNFLMPTLAIALTEVLVKRLKQRHA
ncbi:MULTISPECIES: MurR/RpiR family transcriptional regulator [Agrobacterium]|uniref:Als operon repressor n=1 Tax=Agrobacterium rosae TaxID=1972867 RepID=A0A1R3U0R2_9HYPH|nr:MULTISPECIES: MurR/RpiR family transcriptional regulator [Agrobacterium]SCX29115.1 Als operon repressor [Agrobacterium sp. DSM 25558]SCX30887.1 Als operon repressor [Agrobacterium rosae]